MPFSSLRNRVHLAVTPQRSPQRAAPRTAEQGAPARRAGAGRDIPLARSVVAEGPANPLTADPSLRRMVQAVPNQLR
jgi:hypothetical protein